MYPNYNLKHIVKFSYLNYTSSYLLIISKVFLYQKYDSESFSSADCITIQNTCCPHPGILSLSKDYVYLYHYIPNSGYVIYFDQENV